MSGVPAEVHVNNAVYSWRICQMCRIVTDKTNKLACAPSEDSDQPGYPPSLIRVYTVRLMGTKDPTFLLADSGLWSDWADVQADLSLRWAHMPLCWFRHDAAQM